MVESDFLTTKSTEWSRNNSISPLWKKDGVEHKVFEDHEELPLKYIRSIGDLSQGGVMEKRETEDGMLVAVKTMSTWGKADTINEVTREVGILRSLKHYHTVSLVGTYTRGDDFSAVMVPCATCNFYTYLSQPTSLAFKDITTRYGSQEFFLPKVMGCLAHGLQYLHKVPRMHYDTDGGKIVRHRDITLTNIVLDGSRVLYTDFGLSKFVTATRTGSSGSSHKTVMYTSPERAAKKHRNTSCDIFSLGCVFAEIFNVYKKKTHDEFLKVRIEADPEQKGCFYKPEVMSAVFRWLDDLITERCDVQIIRLLHQMLSFEPKRRPHAEQVWKSLTTVTTSSSDHATYFCGPCCMPLVHGDPLLKIDLSVDLSQTEYSSSSPTDGATSVSRDLEFKDRYSRDQQLDISWNRNLRHWDYAVLDAVLVGDNPNFLARKRIISTANGEGSNMAHHEAEILRHVKHRHIVTLYGTYQHGDVLTLLFEPAADHDLTSYLELAESHQMRKLNFDVDFMKKSFGCLADAVAKVHEAGYDHGDIRPDNILVHNGRIYLSKFSFGLKSKENRRASFKGVRRFIDMFDRLSLGWPEDTHTSASAERLQREESVIYQAPEWRPTDVAQPQFDIFALGCVFLEIYTVLCGERVREFAEFRAADKGNIAYKHTLPKTLEWLSKLTKGHENQEEYQRVIRNMIEKDPGQRPEAKDVARIMRGLSVSGSCNEH